MFLVALSILPCIVMLFYRRPMLLLYLWPMFILINSIFNETGLAAEGFAQRSLWLLPMDPVYFFTIAHLALYSLLNPKRFSSLLKENLFLSIFLFLVALYVVLYTPLYGKAAIGEARKFYFMFLFPLLALVGIRSADDLRRFVQVVMLSAVFIVLYAIALAAMHGTIVRVLGSEFTLIMAFAAFAMLIFHLYKIVVFHRVVDRLLLFSFAVFTIVSGERSVWLAVGLGSLLLLFLYASRRTLMARIAVAAVAFVVGVGTSFVYFPKLGAELGKKFAGILNPSSDDTASWRIEGWQQQLDRLQQRGQLLFGGGLGNYYWWKPENGIVLSSPHNAYIQATLKFGLFGLTIYGLLAFQFFRRVLRVRKTVRTGPIKAYLDMGILNFGAAQAYGLGYGFEPAMLVFFALALTAAKLCEDCYEVSQFSTMTSPAYSNQSWQRSRLADAS